MPRIRSVKPEFWGDEKLALEDDCPRLVFLGIISMADDFGRLLDSPKQIEAFMYPHHDRSRDVREALARLSELGVIVRGSTASGQAVIQITNWTKHQRVDHPNKRAALPEIFAASEDTNIREILAKDDRAFREGLASRSTIYEQRSTSTSSRQRANDSRIAELVNRIAAEPNRMIVEQFIAELPEGTDPEPWAAALVGYLDGLGLDGMRPSTPAALCLACQEYLQLPDAQRSWKAKHFRAFVESAMRPAGVSRERGPPPPFDANPFRTITEALDAQGRDTIADEPAA